MFTFEKMGLFIFSTTWNTVASLDKSLYTRYQKNTTKDSCSWSRYKLFLVCEDHQKIRSSNQNHQKSRKCFPHLVWYHFKTRNQHFFFTSNFPVLVGYGVGCGSAFQISIARDPQHCTKKMDFFLAQVVTIYMCSLFLFSPGTDDKLGIMEVGLFIGLTSLGLYFITVLFNYAKNYVKNRTVSFSLRYRGV